MEEVDLDRPAAFGDLLWEIFVVQLAAFLDRLTLRQIIAFIPVFILIVAYAHSIPLPPELMLVGDVLAYFDIFSVILLLSIMSNTAAVWFVVKQAAEHAAKLVIMVRVGVQQFYRHRREGGARNQKRATSRSKVDDEFPAVQGVAWA